MIDCDDARRCVEWLIGRLLRAAVLAMLHVLAGECDGRMCSWTMALLHESISLLLYPHLHPILHQPIPVCHEIKTARPVWHRGMCAYV